MNSTRRRTWAIIAIFGGALLGLFLSIPIGSTTTDASP